MATSGISAGTLYSKLNGNVWHWRWDSASQTRSPLAHLQHWEVALVAARKQAGGLADGRRYREEDAQRDQVGDGREHPLLGAEDYQVSPRLPVPSVTGDAR
jgi:hypothetical protein